MEVNTSQRKIYFDVLKLFAIFIVLWGHCVQFFGGGYFWTNPVFEFIYSFHMPLFMVVSGYFFSSSLRSSFSQVLKKKATQLLLPVISWAFIITFFIYLSELLKGSDFDVSEVLTKLLMSIRGDLWFLKCLFSCFILSYISMRVFKRTWLACLIANLFFLFIPSLFAEIFLLPFFWMGFFISKYSLWIERHKGQLLIASLSVYLILFSFWTGRDTIYATPMHTLINWKTATIEFTNYGIAFYRFLVGAMGAMSVILFFSIFVKETTFTRRLSKWGGLTMGIYIIQFYLLQVWLSNYDLPRMPSLLYDFVVTPVLSLLILIFAIICCRIIKKSPYISRFLLGSPL